MILVVLENQRGKIHPFSIEAVAAGQKFAEKLNCELSILCIGEKVDELKSQTQSFKANKLILAQHAMCKVRGLVRTNITQPKSIALLIDDAEQCKEFLWSTPGLQA